MIERLVASPELIGRALILMRFVEKRKLIFLFPDSLFLQTVFWRDYDAHAHRLVRLWRTLPGTSFAMRNRVQCALVDLSTIFFEA